MLGTWRKSVGWAWRERTQERGHKGGKGAAGSKYECSGWSLVPCLFQSQDGEGERGRVTSWGGGGERNPSGWLAY